MKTIMKYMMLCVCMMGILGMFSAAEAQRKKDKKKMSRAEKKAAKKEKKEWKKRLKKLKPEQYKALMEEYYSLKDAVGSADERVNACQQELGEKTKTIGDYQKELAKLREGAKRPGTKTVSMPAGKSDNYAQGVVFKIQIGAYENLDASQHAGQEGFGVEKSGSLNRYTIGNFRTFREADELKKILKKMGLRDAWLVSYKDGVRVNMKEVMNDIR